MNAQGLGPVQSIVVFLVVVFLGAFPWLLSWARRADEKRRERREEIRRSRMLPIIMTGRQAAGRHAYGEAYRWEPRAMDAYDYDPDLRAMWEMVAEIKRIREPRA